MHATVVSNSLLLLKKELVVWIWGSDGVSIEKKDGLVAVEMGVTETFVMGIVIIGTVHTPCIVY
eukprot:8572957-Ditylum_brightwellii.AAC.1